MKQDRIAQLFLVAVISAFVGASILFGIPLVDLEGNTLQKIGSYVVASLFWLSLINEIIFIILCNVNRKKLLAAEKADENDKKALPGVFSFFSNKEAMITDIVLFAALIAVGFLFQSKWDPQWLIIGSVAILYLSFNLHCLLNGKNYKYIKTKIIKKGERKNE